MLVLEVVGGLLVALAIAAVALRAIKIRRDAHGEGIAPEDRRLVTPPPSPYTPSRGFRLLDETGEPLVRPPVQRPRLDPGRPYVFSDSIVHHEDALPTNLHHSDAWYLSRSAHRSTSSLVVRVVGIVLVLAIVIAVVTTYYLDRTKKSSNGSATSATTTLAPPATTTTVPVAFRPVATSGDDARYAIPVARYRVTVSGVHGETWTVYNMGPSNTLEWQGPIALGGAKSLVMTGDSRITLGSPSSASVSVDGHHVVLPTPLPVTLVLVFDAKSVNSTSPA